LSAAPGSPPTLAWFAEVSPTRWQRQWHASSPKELVVWLAVLGLGAATTCLAVRFLAYRVRRRSFDRPGRLLFSMCRAHRLPWSQWWLLRRIARIQGLQDPVRLFVEPERLDPARLGPQFYSRQAQILAMRLRLFGELATGTRTRDGA
jgi:hypothetical protein